MRRIDGRQERVQRLTIRAGADDGSDGSGAQESVDRAVAEERWIPDP